MSSTRLRRSSKEKMLFGVAGGLAGHFDVDPVLVRVAFVVLCFVDLIGLIAYVALAIIMPRDEAGDAVPSEAHDTPRIEGSGQGPTLASGKSGSRNFLALILIAIGALILVGNFGWILGISGWLLGLGFITLLPLLLIGIGAAILLGRARRT